jgi:hypothetical protein
MSEPVKGSPEWIKAEQAKVSNGRAVRRPVRRVRRRQQLEQLVLDKQQH